MARPARESDDVLGSRETLAEGRKGKSFQGFYDLLLSQRGSRN